MTDSIFHGRCITASTALLALLLGGCSSGPKPADWQLEAKGAMERSVAAYLEGNSRVEAVELARARIEISSTGRFDLLAAAALAEPAPAAAARCWAGSKAASCGCKLPAR